MQTILYHWESLSQEERFAEMICPRSNVNWKVTQKKYRIKFV